MKLNFEMLTSLTNCFTELSQCLSELTNLCWRFFSASLSSSISFILFKGVFSSCQGKHDQIN